MPSEKVLSNWGGVESEDPRGLLNAVTILSQIKDLEVYGVQSLIGGSATISAPFQLVRTLWRGNLARRGWRIYFAILSAATLVRPWWV